MKLSIVLERWFVLLHSKDCLLFRESVCSAVLSDVFYSKRSFIFLCYLLFNVLGFSEMSIISLSHFFSRVMSATIVIIFITTDSGVLLDLEQKSRFLRDFLVSDLSGEILFLVA
jgi:hypothetical protein